MGRADKIKVRKVGDQPKVGVKDVVDVNDFVHVNTPEGAMEMLDVLMGLDIPDDFYGSGTMSVYMGSLANEAGPFALVVEVRGVRYVVYSDVAAGMFTLKELLARIYEAQVEGGYEAFMYFIDNLNDLMVETFGDGDRESH